ncbi:MAG: histidine phosphotransferase [Candidatus Liberibacter europaeus]|uniref:Histidine phosphotransferase n=1 Tax=Candidatus Liberibacter europaeus TaxID=744859 RepID=A0A2T4VWR1_9HYPH|nr:histidine phosphotransferase [Candidatus Liberibacter europaeus]PTL86225.1 MAG: histidine phosphotransferase [Candidatus Liberibacter europaeus]
MLKNPCFNLSSADLSALLCSRICHDIISPVGAINNGLELLDEDGIEDEAMQLIRLSTVNAITRLKFSRLAFGHPGYNNTTIELSEIKDIINDFSAIDNKVKVYWSLGHVVVSRQNAKLLLNLFMIAYISLPKGGDLKISINHSVDESIFSLKINSDFVRFPEKFIRIMSGDMDFQIDSYDVQFYYTSLLAHENDVELSYKIIDDSSAVFFATIKN